MLRFDKTVPIFRIFDVAKAREFYVDFLGFKIDWEHKFADVAPVYMQLSLGDCVLHLSEHHGDCCPGSTAFVRVASGLEDYHRAILAKRYGYMRPGLEIAPWNARTMEVIDPFGNRLRFSQDLEAKES